MINEFGMGVEKDLPKVKKLIEAASSAGDSRGSAQLGLLHMRGDGVPEDATRAAQYLTQAASSGDDAGVQVLGELYEDGS